MLTASLLLSSFMLAGVWLLTRSRFGIAGGTWAAVGGLLFQFLCIAMQAVSTVFALNALLVLIAGIVCRVRSATPRTFLASALAATAASYLICGAFAFHHDVREQRQLQKEFPYESMAVRLGYERQIANVKSGDVTPAPDSVLVDDAQPATINAHLVELEGSFETGSRMSYRARLFQQLHEDSVQTFINAESFGLSRMIRFRRGYIEWQDNEPIPLPTPEPWPYRPVLAGEEDAPQSPGVSSGEMHVLRDATWSMHKRSAVDFANEDGWGYVRDREHVAGFLSHRFHQEPRLAMQRIDQEEPSYDESWKLVRLELVSLLKFPVPRVYVSENLPRMDDLDATRSRELDAFEDRSLVALRAGEDLVHDVEPRRLLMLGSLRALKQCTECHQVERGTLLGAFSYELRRPQSFPVPEVSPVDDSPAT